MLEAIRFLKIKNIKFYQASTSELSVRLTVRIYLVKNLNFIKVTLWGIKLYSYWITSVYRESYGIFACNGILFNHESQEEENLLLEKLQDFGKKKLGSKEILYLGNLNAKRDWGHAKDYTEIRWRILQQRNLMILYCYKAFSVRQFIEIASNYLKLKIYWQGKGLKEVGYLKKGSKKEVIIKIDKNYFRPNEVEYLRGDARKAFRVLKFKPKYSFKNLVKDMIESDLIEAEKKFEI